MPLPFCCKFCCFLQHSFAGYQQRQICPSRVFHEKDLQAQVTNLYTYRRELQSEYVQNVNRPFSTLCFTRFLRRRSTFWWAALNLLEGYKVTVVIWLQTLQLTLHFLQNTDRSTPILLKLQPRPLRIRTATVQLLPCPALPYHSTLAKILPSQARAKIPDSLMIPFKSAYSSHWP